MPNLNNYLQRIFTLKAILNKRKGFMINPTNSNLSYLNGLNKISINVDDVSCLFSAKDFKRELLKQIKKATTRIYLAALYLEDDDAGSEILDALYNAKRHNPSLDIHVCIDYHRAQRGLIGEKKAPKTNALWYQRVEQAEKLGVNIIGIPVKRKELFGVQHLKGFVFDDLVFYSGASFNNIYLHQKDRYRYDRYWLINSRVLANSMVEFIQTHILNSPCVAKLNSEKITTVKTLKAFQAKFTSSLKKASYKFVPERITENSKLCITPLCGLGAKNNELNRTITSLLACTKNEAVIFTPYFNLPKSIANEIDDLLDRGVHLTIVVGDKTANDFYIADEDKFTTIGALPYLYELNLQRFCKKHQSKIATNQLEVNLWKDEGNSFHLKGIYCDQRYVLLTGHNLNPRAWRQDLENGLLFDDFKQELKPLLDKELETILKNTKKISHSDQIENLNTYPKKVQKIINRMRRIHVDKLVKRII